MKTVILCGGRGTRLREETQFKPKPMVEVGGMPLLWHIMKTYSHYGYKDFILCLGYKGEMIKDYFLRFRDNMHDFTLQLSKDNQSMVHHNGDLLEDWNITFANTGDFSKTGSRICKIKKYLSDDEDFFLTYGDGVAQINLPETYSQHKKSGRVVTVTAIRPPSLFGVLDTDDGLAKSFVEKPVMNERVSGGFFVCNKRIFDYLSLDDNCALEDELRKLALEGQLATYNHDDFWYTVNTHKDWEEINEMEMRGETPWKIWEDRDINQEKKNGK